jgi:hypothetical protein
VQGGASSNPAAPTSNTKGFQAIAGNPFSLRVLKYECSFAYDFTIASTVVAMQSRRWQDGDSGAEMTTATRWWPLVGCWALICPAGCVARVAPVRRTACAV